MTVLLRLSLVVAIAWTVYATGRAVAALFGYGLPRPCTLPEVELVDPRP